MPGPTTITETQQALIVAMELLRKGLGEDAIATAINTQRSQQQYADLGKKLEDFVAGGKPSGHPAPADATMPPTTGGNAASAGSTAPTTTGQSAVFGELQKVNKNLEALPLKITETLKGKNPEEADALHAVSKSKFDTLGFGRDEGFGGSRVPAGWSSARGSASRTRTRKGSAPVALPAQVRRSSAPVVQAGFRERAPKPAARSQVRPPAQSGCRHLGVCKRRHPSGREVPGDYRPIGRPRANLK
jgi:hypothetical protein